MSKYAGKVHSLLGKVRSLHRVPKQGILHTIMEQWAKRHPRAYAVGGAFVILATGLATFQGIWNLFSNEPFLPYISARLPHWAQIVSPIIFGSLFIVCIVFVVKTYRLSVLYKTNRGLAIAKYLVGILEKIEKRDLQLKDSAVRQYKSLFSLSDLLMLCSSIASTNVEFVEFLKNIKTQGVSDGLKQDKIERRQQIDSVYEGMRPIFEKEWTLERLVANANKLDAFPKMQNSRYEGIRTRREKDKRWRRLFASLSNVKMEYPDIFANDELETMIKEYIDMSFGCSSICCFAELCNLYVPVDIQPTALIDSGMYAPYSEVQNQMVKLKIDISNKIKKLASELDNKQETTNKATTNSVT